MSRMRLATIHGAAAAAAAAAWSIKRAASVIQISQ